MSTLKRSHPGMTSGDSHPAPQSPPYMQRSQASGDVHPAAEPQTHHPAEGVDEMTGTLKLEILSVLIAKQFFCAKCHLCSLRTTGRMALEAHGLKCSLMARCAGCVTSWDIKFGRWCQSANRLCPRWIGWTERVCAGAQMLVVRGKLRDGFRT